jgi:hypothetical protein
MDLPFGAPVEPFVNGRRRAGEALVKADGPEELRRLVAFVRAMLDVKAV